MPKTGENIYKRKDGRWEARFISGRKPDGRAKYTSVYARTYAAAKAKLEERKRMVVSPQAVNCRLTVSFSIRSMRIPASNTTARFKTITNKSAGSQTGSAQKMVYP